MLGIILGGDVRFLADIPLAFTECDQADDALCSAAVLRCAPPLCRYAECLVDLIGGGYSGDACNRESLDVLGAGWEIIAAFFGTWADGNTFR
jgi:hypothetical protein